MGRGGSAEEVRDGVICGMEGRGEGGVKGGNMREPDSIARTILAVVSRLGNSACLSVALCKPKAKTSAGGSF